MLPLVIGLTETSIIENGFTQPLLLSSREEQEDEDEDQECDPSEETEEEIHKPVTSVVSAYRLLTPSVKVLILYFILPLSQIKNPVLLSQVL